MNDKEKDDKSSTVYRISKYGDCVPALIQNVYRLYNINKEFLYTTFAENGFELYKSRGVIRGVEAIKKFGIKCKEENFDYFSIKQKIDSILVDQKKIIMVLTKTLSSESRHAYLLVNRVNVAKMESNHEGKRVYIQADGIYGYECIGRGNIENGRFLVVNHDEMTGDQFFKETAYNYNVHSVITFNTILQDLGLTEKEPYKKSQGEIVTLLGLSIPFQTLKSERFKRFSRLHRILNANWNGTSIKHKRLILENKTTTDNVILFNDNLQKNQSLEVKNVVTHDFYRYSINKTGKYKGIIEINSIIELKDHNRLANIKLNVKPNVEIATIRKTVKCLAMGIQCLSNEELNLVTNKLSPVKVVEEFNVIDINGGESLNRQNFILKFDNNLSRNEGFEIALDYIKNGYLSNEIIIKNPRISFNLSKNSTSDSVSIICGESASSYYSKIEFIHGEKDRLLYTESKENSHTTYNFLISPHISSEALVKCMKYALSFPGHDFKSVTIESPYKLQKTIIEYFGILN